MFKAHVLNSSNWKLGSQKSKHESTFGATSLYFFNHLLLPFFTSHVGSILFGWPLFLHGSGI